MAQVRDTLLRAFISLAESKFEIETPVTVNAQGVMIEGYIIPRRKYIKSAYEALRGATVATPNNPGASEEMGALWASVLGEMAQKADSAGPDDQFVYLRDVKILTITKLVDFPSLWCVALDNIGAWTVGHSESSPEL